MAPAKRSLKQVVADVGRDRPEVVFLTACTVEIPALRLLSAGIRAAVPGIRVLVVDDDTYVCDVVSRVLQNHQYETVVAHSGDDALEHLRVQAFDVVLTDVRMPGDYDGIDLHDRVVAQDPAFGEAHLLFAEIVDNWLSPASVTSARCSTCCRAPSSCTSACWS